MEEWHDINDEDVLVQASVIIVDFFKVKVSFELFLEASVTYRPIFSIANLWAFPFNFSVMTDDAIATSGLCFYETIVSY